MYGEWFEKFGMKLAFMKNIWFNLKYEYVYWEFMTPDSFIIMMCANDILISQAML